ncbi:MAG: shikimate dehydrogenase [Bacillota bacterium]|nr:shikimate dehydrogenase [Bacillota bacterium]REJ36330.1 MAG: shikimate dehydrogenase [Bacillota bacterium]
MVDPPGAPAGAPGPGLDEAARPVDRAGGRRGWRPVTRREERPVRDPGVPDQRPPVSPATVLCALLGSPVAHSGSPAMHDAAFAATGRDARYLAFDVSAAGFPAAVRGLAALGAAGANVTIPHKEQALALADEATDRARRSGSANVLAFRDGRVLADDTDGAGFARAVAEAGARLEGAALLLLGAGGAARAVSAAALDGGAAQVWVYNRSPERAVKLARDLDPSGRRVRVLEAGDLGGAVAGADLVVNATSLGLRPDDPSPLAAAPGGWGAAADLWLQARPGTVAVDIVYAPHDTAFLRGARAAGLRTVDGRRMLVWQAALAWEAWFGETGPVDVMAAALDRWLERRRGAGA